MKVFYIFIIKKLFDDKVFPWNNLKLIKILYKITWYTNNLVNNTILIHK